MTKPRADTPYLYQVTSPGGVPMMRTEHPEYRYDAETELQMLDAGYRITVNGKRVTKKSLLEAIQSKPSRNGEIKTNARRRQR